jgi:large subunit ribosomal protein L32
MAVPKKRTTRSKRNMRRSNTRVENISLSTDISTGEVHLRHHVTNEGYYKGKKIIQNKSKKEKIDKTESTD